MLAGAKSPALVVGAPEEREWDGVVALAERLRCPVWQESFSRRVGFPQDHPLFAGHLPWQRRLMQDALAGYDMVLDGRDQRLQGCICSTSWSRSSVAPGTPRRGANGRRR